MIYSRHIYQNDEDYGRIRAFLREVFLRNHRQELSWQVARLDYWRYFINEHIDHYPLSQATSIFETVEGSIAGVVTADGRGNAYLNVHPDLRTPDLECLMLETAEASLTEPDPEGRGHLTVWASQNDRLRIQLLQERGYRKGEWPEHQY